MLRRLTKAARSSGLT